MSAIIVTKEAPLGFVIDPETRRRCTTRQIREEAERLRTVLENPEKATTRDRQDQQLLVEASLVDDDLEPAEKAEQAAWLLWLAWDEAAADREVEEFDAHMVGERFRAALDQ
jgi:hypothetical protein